MVLEYMYSTRSSCYHHHVVGSTPFHCKPIFSHFPTSVINIFPAGAYYCMRSLLVPMKSREAMWGCLAKFGVPPTLLARIEALHTNMTATYQVEPGDDHELPNTSGCIQGSCLASPTFNVVIQCAMEVAKATGNINGIDFFTATEQEAGVRTGRGIVGANWKRRAGRAPLNFWVSLYADDAAATETTRDRLQASLNVTVNTLPWRALD